MKTHLVLFVPATLLVLLSNAIAQPLETPLAEPQQAALAKEILSADREEYERAVLVAQAIGPDRMSDDVRVALITLLGRLNDTLDVATRNRAVLDDVVHGEFYLALADLVADLHDPRAITPLTRIGDYGFNRRAARVLASFGELALPAILKIVENPASSGDAIAYNLDALSSMVDDRNGQTLSASARADITRVAKTSLRSQHGKTLLMGTELAVALNDPDLMQEVTALAQDTASLRARGVAEPTADLVRKHAAATLAKSAARGTVPP